MDFFQHFGNCHGEMTLLVSLLTSLPVVGVLFSRFRKHKCCDHKD